MCVQAGGRAWCGGAMRARGRMEPASAFPGSSAHSTRAGSDEWDHGKRCRGERKREKDERRRVSGVKILRLPVAPVVSPLFLSLRLVSLFASLPHLTPGWQRSAASQPLAETQKDKSVEPTRSLDAGRARREPTRARIVTLLSVGSTPVFRASFVCGLVSPRHARVRRLDSPRVL